MPRTHDSLSPSTLLVGSLSSAASALVVHEFWRAGAIVAAGVTPILVALFGELLRRPVIHVHARAESLTGPRPVRVRTAPTGEALRVYRAQPRWRLAFVTGLVAFALGAGGLTLSELMLDRSVGDGKERTTLFGAHSPRSAPGTSVRSAAPSARPRTERSARERPAREVTRTRRSSERPEREAPAKPAPAPAPAAAVTTPSTTTPTPAQTTTPEPPPPAQTTPQPPPP